MKTVQKSHVCAISARFDALLSCLAVKVTPVKIAAKLSVATAPVTSLGAELVVYSSVRPATAVIVS